MKIIGGGLAGLGVALALARRGISAVLHEAGHYPRHRVCGEFLAGLDAATVDELGLKHLLKDSIRGLSTQWFLRDQRVWGASLPAPVLALSRHTMDYRMVCQIRELGGQVHTGSRQTPENAGEGTVLATGRPRNTHSTWIGMKQHYRDLPLTADLEMHLGKRAYAGCAPVEDGKTNVCALLPIHAVGGTKYPLDRLPSALQAVGLKQLAQRLADAEPVPDSLCSCAGFQTGWSSRPWKDPVDAGDPMLLGDRLARIPPLTGNGMTMALQSAALVAEPLAAWARGECDWRGCLHTASTRLGRAFRTRMAAAERMQAVLTEPAGQLAFRLLTRLHSVPFRTLFRLTH